MKDSVNSECRGNTSYEGLSGDRHKMAIAPLDGTMFREYASEASIEYMTYVFREGRWSEIKASPLDAGVEVGDVVFFSLDFGPDVGAVRPAIVLSVYAGFVLDLAVLTRGKFDGGEYHATAVDLAAFDAVGCGRPAEAYTSATWIICNQVRHGIGDRCRVGTGGLGVGLPGRWHARSRPDGRR